MRRATRESVIKAISRRLPPQRVQCSTSISKTRFISSAQVGWGGGGGGDGGAGGKRPGVAWDGTGWGIVSMAGWDAVGAGTISSRQDEAGARTPW